MTEQERNLRIVWNVAITMALVVIVVGCWGLYFGHELPPHEMSQQLTDATGYAPPPRFRQGGVMGSVPRSGVERRLPDTQDGSIPPQATRWVNPLVNDSNTLREGAQVYAIHCSMCHGKTGHGTGPVGDSYIPRPPDLTTQRVRMTSDGALFYVVTNGILSTPVREAEKYLPRQWHSFRATTSERERWAVVSFLKKR